MQIAPDIFEVRDDDFLYVLDETPSEDRRSNLEESVQILGSLLIYTARTWGGLLEPLGAGV